ncbi:MAG: alpha/beta fold hydrolase [Actinomycetes bacterium]
MATRSIEGAAVHTTGDGQPIVLLHANGGDSSDFDAVRNRLAATHTVHAIDWPGWGEAAADPSPTALGYAALLPRILDALGGGPFVLLGNSVGGFAAIHTAATRPDLVRALVLVDPGGFTARWPGSVLACRVIGSARVAPTMMRVLPRLYLRHRNATVDTIRSNATAMSHDPARVAAFASIWRSFADPDHDAREAATRVGVPTLLAWGRHDPVLPWPIDGRRARRSFPDATIATFACGHQPFAELPDAFLAAVEPFLADIFEEAP